ncbi:hypothetical protein JXB41_06625 [Candidatus Woesearchaeota archaeon]|nr:hypothetical protein [Candidatus Woesearchaeota archaeon]
MEPLELILEFYKADKHPNDSIIQLESMDDVKAGMCIFFEYYGCFHSVKIEELSSDKKILRIIKGQYQFGKFDPKTGTVRICKELDLSSEENYLAFPYFDFPNGRVYQLLLE